MWPSSRRLSSGCDPLRAITIADLRAMAHRRLPAFVTEYIEGGAETETTLSRNGSVFDSLAFRFRVMSGIAAFDRSTEIFGQPCASPILIAPTGFAGLAWRDGDIALARAAARGGSIFIQSIASNSLIEDVAAVPGLRHWLQLYVFRDRKAVSAILDRALAAGCEALVVTVDSPVYGNREWDRRNFRSPTALALPAKLDVLTHWRWMADVLRRGIPGFVNLYAFLKAEERNLFASAEWARNQVDSRFGWDDLASIRAIWPHRLIVKGIGHVADALRAVELGADGIVVSNHGGRQFDGALPPLAMMRDVAAELKGKTLLLMDSGIRRGTDALKALAMGADAVLIGRAALYGLGAAGEAGVARALAILDEEMARSMALLGIGKISELMNADIVRYGGCDPEGRGL